MMLGNIGNVLYLNFFLVLIYCILFQENSCLFVQITTQEQNYNHSREAFWKHSKLKGAVSIILNYIRYYISSHYLNKACTLEVFKCLHGIALEAFKDYFRRVEHLRSTRANNVNIVLPKLKQGRKPFFIRELYFLISYQLLLSQNIHFLNL